MKFIETLHSELFYIRYKYTILKIAALRWPLQLLYQSLDCDEYIDKQLLNLYLQFKHYNKYYTIHTYSVSIENKSRHSTNALSASSLRASVHVNLKKYSFRKFRWQLFKERCNSLTWRTPKNIIQNKFVPLNNHDDLKFWIEVDSPCSCEVHNY